MSAQTTAGSGLPPELVQSVSEAEGEEPDVMRGVHWLSRRRRWEVLGLCGSGPPGSRTVVRLCSCGTVGSRRPTPAPQQSGASSLFTSSEDAKLLVAPLWQLLRVICQRSEVKAADVLVVLPAGFQLNLLGDGGALGRVCCCDASFILARGGQWQLLKENTHTHTSKWLPTL